MSRIIIHYNIGELSERDRDYLPVKYAGKVFYLEQCINCSPQTNEGVDGKYYFYTYKHNGVRLGKVGHYIRTSLATIHHPRTRHSGVKVKGGRIVHRRPSVKPTPLIPLDKLLSPL